MGRRIPPLMLKYLYRTCPKCGDYLGVVVPDPPGPMSEIPIDAHCVVCGFKLGWRLVLGKRSSSKLTKLVLFFLVLSISACSKQAEAEWRLVTRVVDGDTIIVGARERVRLLGVDTPETKHPRKPVEYKKETGDSLNRPAPRVFIHHELDSTFFSFKTSSFLFSLFIWEKRPKRASSLLVLPAPHEVQTVV